MPMSAMRIFDSLGIRRNIEAIGTPLTIYGRADQSGGALASMNFSSLRTYQDYPTLGVNYLELERTLQELVAKKSVIRPQCIVQSIESLPAPDTQLAHVKWISNYMTSRNIEKGLYDCVLVSEGPFSLSREMHWPEGYSLEGVSHLFEAVIPRPASVMKGYSSDQWGNDRRVGFYPAGGSNRDQLYIFAQVRLPEHGGPALANSAASADGSDAAAAAAAATPPKQESVPATQLLECFTEFGGPWRDVAESIAALPSVNRTIVLSGNFAGDHPPVKGRVAAIGASSMTVPGPCLGHDLSVALNTAQFVANSVSFAQTPVLFGLHSFLHHYPTYAPMIEAIRNELHAAILYNTRIPKFFARWLYKSAFSDKGLVAQQMDFLGLKMSKEEQIDANPLQRIQQLREEWHKMSEADRASTKQRVHDDMKRLEDRMERELAAMKKDQS